MTALRALAYAAIVLAAVLALTYCAAQLDAGIANFGPDRPGSTR